MPKPSDLLNRTGGAGPSGPQQPANFTNPAQAGDKPVEDRPSIASQRPDLGHNLHKGTEKGKGGAGQSSARPKV